MSFTTHVRCDIVGCDNAVSFNNGADFLPSGWLAVYTTNRHFEHHERNGATRHACPSHTKQLFGYEDAQPS